MLRQRGQFSPCSSPTRCRTVNPKSFYASGNLLVKSQRISKNSGEYFSAKLYFLTRCNVKVKVEFALAVSSNRLLGFAAAILIVIGSIPALLNVGGYSYPFSSIPSVGGSL